MPDAAQDLERWLVQQVELLLRLKPGTVQPQRPLADYGLDSVRVVGLTGELERRLGRGVDASVFLEFPSAAELARHLVG